MIDTKHIGYKLAPHTVDVEKGQLRLFAKAVGETNPIYLDEIAARDAGHAALPAPPTFAFSLNLMNPNPFEFLDLLGVDLSRILHGEQAFRYHAPIYAGDTITIEGEITDIYDKKGGALEFVVQEFVATNQDGTRVVEMSNTTVVRNPAGGDA